MNRITTKIVVSFFLIMATFQISEMPFANKGFAAVHSVTATGSYEMGEEDSILAAKQKALDEAKRNAAEQVGIYVETETVVESNIISKDTITLMTAQFMHIQGEPIWKRVTIGDFGTKLTVTINACIDDNDLNVLRKRIDDKFILKKYEELQSNYKKLQDDNRNLKLQLGMKKKEEDKEQIINKLSSNEKVYRANNYMLEFSKYDSSNPDFINKGGDLLRKIHHLLDNNLSTSTAISLYLDLGVDELTFEIIQDTRDTNAFNSKLARINNPSQRNRLRNEFRLSQKRHAQRYYDISTYYINFAESLSKHSDYIYKKYCAMETYYGYKGIALKMMGDHNGASVAIDQAEYYLSLIPKSSEYYKPCLENFQAIKENIAVR